MSRPDKEIINEQVFKTLVKHPLTMITFPKQHITNFFEEACNPHDQALDREIPDNPHQS